MVKQENNCVYDINYQTMWLTAEKVNLFRTDDRREMIRCIIMGIDAQREDISINKIEIDDHYVTLTLSTAPSMSPMSAINSIREDIKKAWFLEFPLDGMLMNNQLWSNENVIFSLNADTVQDKMEKRAKNAIESFRISMDEKSKGLF